MSRRPDPEESLGPTGAAETAERPATDERLPDRILRRLDARFVFVVGKGGVGKSTTAAALALGSADRGTITHLISTDPAHSIPDVLRLDGAPAESGIRDGVCGVPLTVECFDATSRAEAWVAEARGPVSELFELGTYLEADDVRRFLDLSLPGVDEVLGALRLAELADGGAERIVVDTAPAGHALRLFDAGEVLGSWIRALRAMSRKATAVAEGLTHRTVRLAADAFVDDLEAEVRRFDEEVLPAACFVTVTRSDRVVEEGTRRLGRALGVRDLRECARVAIGGDAEPRNGVPSTARFAVPLRARPTGCEGLRRWGRPDASADGTERVSPVGPASAPGEPALPELQRLLLRRRIAFFAGKGGVGKSTCAAACALLAAEERPTVLVSTDPAGSLSTILDVEVTREGVEVAPGLRARQLDAEAELDRFLDRARDRVERIFEGLGVGREAALDRDVVNSLLELAPPGIDEIFALVVVMELMEEGDAGVVVDAAPTGHFLRLIQMPGVALGWIHALMRALLEYRSLAGLDDAAERLVGLSERVKRLRSLLVDPGRTAALLITLDEPVVRAESIRLHERMAASEMPPTCWIHNRRSAGVTEDDGVPPGPMRFGAPGLEESPRGVQDLRAFVGRWWAVS